MPTNVEATNLAPANSRSLSLRAYIMAIGGALILIFAALGVVGSIKIAKIKIGGDLYSRIVDGKDLVADILPPPLYIIEAYVEAQSLHDDPTRFAESKKKLDAFRADFEKQHAVWARSAMPSAIKEELIRSAKDDVAPFWREVESTFLPAAERSDVASTTASIARLGKLFAAHKTGISGVLEKATAFLKEKEAEAARVSADLQTEAMLLAGLLIFTLLGIYLSARSVLLKPLLSIRNGMMQLAGGNLRIDIPPHFRLTEARNMAATLSVFRAAAIEKQQLEAAAERDRAEAEAERTAREAEKQKDADDLASAIAALGKGLEALTAGVLTHQITTAFPGHLDKLRQDFNATAAGLRETLGAVVNATDAMTSGTSEIASASDDLSRRTEQNAASLEETAAALQQITATVGRTAEATRHARDVVAEATSNAEQGKGIVESAVVAMHKIERSSQQIGQIIGVIDEIAFQTNLLALNAGVEAARAGDAGRGFAVVASEVRALAQRSADAAKEIKGLIHSSTTEVGEGGKLVARAGDALTLIVAKVAEINSVIADIATSAEEQASSLQEVNSAVNDMDKVTQQNAAMAEEATAASQSLANESNQLAALVNHFDLGDKNFVAHIHRDAQSINTSSSQSRPAPKSVQPELTSMAAAGRLPAEPPYVLKRRRVANGSAVNTWQDF